MSRTPTSGSKASLRSIRGGSNSVASGTLFSTGRIHREGAPLDQRGVDGLRCPAYLPQRNYFRFRGSADAKMMLATLNDELRRVGKIEKGIKEGRIELLPDTTINGTQADLGGVQDAPLGGSCDTAITFVAAGGRDGSGVDDPAGIPPEVEQNAEERMRSPGVSAAPITTPIRSDGARSIWMDLGCFK
ncbi:hypothetical protein ACHAXT_005872 [Thalassiosira profunda]